MRIVLKKKIAAEICSFTCKHYSSSVRLKGAAASAQTSQVTLHLEWRCRKSTGYGPYLFPSDWEFFASLYQFIY